MGESGEHHEEHTTSVSLTQKQSESIGLRLGGLEHKILNSGLKANGFLKVPNQNKATITSIYGGIVKNILVMPGSRVSAGQTVAQILYPPLIPMQEEFLSLSPKIELASAELERQVELSNEQAGAFKNKQNAEANLKNLMIRRASLEQQINQMGIRADQLAIDHLVTILDIKSPISGWVGKVFVNIGSSVDASTPIAEVMDNRSLHLDLFVYEKDLHEVRQDQLIDFVLTNQPGKSYTAQVFSIGNTFENENKAIAVHAVVKGNKQGLIDGMNVTALISLKNATVPALPDEAFVNQDGVDFVFVQKVAGAEVHDEHHHEEGDIAHQNEHHEDGHQQDPGEDGHEHKAEEKTARNGAEVLFEKIPIKKGVSDLGYTEVTLLKEVPLNARFVTKGAFFLLAKMSNAGEAHAH